jgi:hypothetical protein
MTDKGPPTEKIVCGLEDAEDTGPEWSQPGRAVLSDPNRPPEPRTLRVLIMATPTEEQTMTDIKAKLDALEKRCNDATEGPWSTEKPSKDENGWPQGIIVAAVARGQAVYANPPGGSFPESDRRFIALARTAFPALVKMAREVERVRDQLYCARTGNLCGTDTWKVGTECQCTGCYQWLRLGDALSDALEGVEP